MRPGIVRGLLIGGFAALAAIAIAGWTRKPAASGPIYPVTAAAYAPGAAQPAFYDAAGRPVYTTTAAVPCEPVTAQTVSVSPARGAVVREADRTYVTPRPVVRRKRSTKKSVAIVAGSAGVGAAIGAIAGGGKGAAIGALSGGTAGFVYDRLTHRR